MSAVADHPETLSFTTSDGSLAYRDAGEGQPLVLLHAGFFDHRMWDEQTRAFAPRYRVIAPDARGHGASSNATRPFRPADDLAALLRHLGVGPAVLVGVSMGGGTAVDTALEYPGLVRAVVVSGVGTSEPYFEDPWSLEVLGDQNSALAAGDIEGWLDGHVRFAAGPHRSPADVDADLANRLRAMASRTISKHTAGEPDHRLPVPHTWRRAASIDVPVLAINGALDVSDHVAMAERLVQAVPDGRAVSVEDTAHFPNMEQPAAFNALLAEFLEALPPS
ncbi:Pimeloyl-ACP methyl ester carboxylesterase [Streptomyces misionensis]|uniref:Pimeloyl-ACP methyl ester carboxylesterase n=1 Tax=Streptomyces misionensis TaxID=67331 RepID=A0A1H5EFU6_9ACTN|nr:alpha/beta hydrolase [Streptomyces misionensis]SED89854.1 Pimeloyl-ACP methyl ester carboxylesterase [Streptomyces misionensis]